MFRLTSLEDKSTQGDCIQNRNTTLFNGYYRGSNSYTKVDEKIRDITESSYVTQKA